MTDHETQDVIERLQAYGRQFGEILTMIERHPLTGATKDHARELLRGLKEELKNDSKAESSATCVSRVTQTEKQYLIPAAQEALAEISVAWNSVPSDEWKSQLYSARLNITHMLHKLKGRQSKIVD